MKFTPLSLPDVLLVTAEPYSDQRGSFARIFCEDIWIDRGLCSTWVQMNQSVSTKKGTVRGLHFQRAPFGEIKMVKCLRGAVMDCFVDLRRDSPTFGQWGQVELRSDSQDMIYIPYGFGHGFQTLEDDTALIYWHSSPYSADHQGGVRFEDVGISLSLPVSSTSERDLTFAPITELDPL